MIVAEDPEFYELMDRLLPQMDIRQILRDNRDIARQHGVRNTTIQGAYSHPCGSALGLDAGPMQGFETRAWMPSSSRTVAGSPTSSSTSATAPRAATGRATHDLSSRTPA